MAGMMERRLAGLAAAAALVLPAAAATAADWQGPPPAVQAPAAMGYAELGYGWFRFDEDSSDDYRDITGAGYANIPLFPFWNLEIEARGNAISDADGGGSEWTQVGGFGHVYWRDPARGALGAFAGYSALGLFGSSADLWTVGGEGLLYVGDFTLLGQAGWQTTDTSRDYLDFDGYFVRAAARYFVGQNLRLQGDVLWSALHNPSWDVDADQLTLVGTAEYRLPNLPLSGFVSARWDDITVEGPASDMETTTIMLGIRGYLGSGSLKDNDRNGAPFDVLPLPPTYFFNLG